MTADPNRKSPAAPLLEGDFPDQAFAEVRDILFERVGFDLGMYKDGCIRRRVARRARSCGARDAADYLQRLRGDKDEVPALMAALTIHVSQFFRNISTFEHLRDQVLPQLIQRLQGVRNRPLKIWCAGCAGGEEPYTLALMLHEMAPLGVPLSLLATDISPDILQRAHEGLYESQRLAEMPDQIRERYFTAEGDRYRLQENIRRMVRFQRHNIMTDTEYPEADLILCRNVLIYFSREEQERIISHFARVLPVGGFLVLGRAENLMGESRALFESENARERIYRRV
ncbi:CheR family methyltransferase [Trichloromonas sp.]|uniref:CheR family methyltransferase n=1 Tax=Trichloromonas sp. TaxID=3069249 RepID=UPI003D81B1A4